MLIGNISKIIRDRVVLNFVIDVWRIVYNSICNMFKGSTTLGYDHPSLIYSLCVAVGAQGESDEEVSTVGTREEI